MASSTEEEADFGSIAAVNKEADTGSIATSKEEEADDGSYRIC